MSESGLRWGLQIGVINAALGVLSLMIGAVFAPLQSQQPSVEAIVIPYFIRGILVLLVLGVALGLSYYAGIRAERSRLELLALESADGAASQPSSASDRSGSVFAGALAMLVYWFVTTLYTYLFPVVPQGGTAGGSQVATLESHVVLGVVFVCLGAGLGGLGSRVPAARMLLDRLIVKPSTVATIAPITPILPEAAGGTTPSDGQVVELRADVEVQDAKN